MKIKTAGYSSTDVLMVHGWQSQCGKILDGVALAHDQDGPWVIAFADLKKLYERAAKARKKPQP